MSRTAIGSLETLVRQLNAERQRHFNAIAEIDASFESLGLNAVKPKKRKGRRGGPKGAGKKKTAKKKTAKKKTAKKTKRRKLKTTAAELVLAAVKKAGKKGATGAQITKAWKAAKRPGDAYNTLGELTKKKKIKRKKVKGERGSRYTAT